MKTITHLVNEYGNIFAGVIGEAVTEMIESGESVENIETFLEKADSVHGDIIIEELADGSVITATGRHYYYKDESYADDSTGYNTVNEGAWVSA